MVKDLFRKLIHEKERNSDHGKNAGIFIMEKEPKEIARKIRIGNWRQFKSLPHFIDAPMTGAI